MSMYIYITHMSYIYKLLLGICSFSQFIGTPLNCYSSNTAWGKLKMQPNVAFLGSLTLIWTSECHWFG